MDIKYTVSELRSRIFRAITGWLLVGTISGVLPLLGASPPPQPGTPAVPMRPSGEIAQIAAEIQPASAAQQPLTPQQQPETTPPAASGASTGPAPTRSHVPRWVWVAVAAGVGVGLGTGLVAANHQTGKAAATNPTITVNPGPVTVGAP